MSGGQGRRARHAAGRGCRARYSRRSTEPLRALGVRSPDAAKLPGPPVERYADDVRHITRCWIPFAERRGLEDMTPRPTAYPAAKVKGDRGMPSKRERSETLTIPSRKARDTVRTDCSNLSLQRCRRTSPDTASYGGATAIGRRYRRRSNLPRGGRWDIVPFRGRTRHLRRARHVQYRGNVGSPDAPRGAGRRSRRSTPRTGKPSTWGRRQVS